MVCSEREHLLILDLGDVYRLPIRSAEAEIAGHGTRQFDCLEDFAFGCHFENFPGTVAGHIDVAVDITADSVESVIFESDEDFLVGDAFLRNVVGENATLLALGDIEPGSVGADFDAVGRSLAVGELGDFAVGVDPPQSAVAVFPVGVAGVERVIGTDRDVVGLVHGGFVRENADLLCRRINSENVVTGVVGDEHLSGPVESDAVAGAALREFDPEFRFSIRGDPGDGPFLLNVDDVEIAFLVAGRAFDSACERFLFGEGGDGERRILADRLGRGEGEQNDESGDHEGMVG